MSSITSIDLESQSSILPAAPFSTSSAVILPVPYCPTTMQSTSSYIVPIILPYHATNGRYRHVKFAYVTFLLMSSLFNVLNAMAGRRNGGHNDGNGGHNYGIGETSRQTALLILSVLAIFYVMDKVGASSNEVDIRRLMRSGRRRRQRAENAFNSVNREWVRQQTAMMSAVNGGDNAHARASAASSNSNVNVEETVTVGRTFAERILRGEELNENDYEDLVSLPVVQRGASSGAALQRLNLLAPIKKYRSLSIAPTSSPACAICTDDMTNKEVRVS